MPPAEGVALVSFTCPSGTRCQVAGNIALVLPYGNAHAVAIRLAPDEELAEFVRELAATTTYDRELVVGSIRDMTVALG